MRRGSKAEKRESYILSSIQTGLWKANIATATDATPKTGRISAAEDANFYRTHSDKSEVEEIGRVDSPDFF